MIEGFIDRVTTSNVTGWIFDRQAGRTFDVMAFLHGRCIGEAVTTVYRADLEQVGFGNGICGFDVPFEANLLDSEKPFVMVKPRGSNLTLPRTAADTYGDLAALPVKRFPGAGRSRTVLGGLWTNRTDALQILAGRAGTGACPSAVQPDLQRFVGEGFASLKAPRPGSFPVEILDAILPKPGAPKPETASLRDAMAAVAPFVVTDELAALMKAAFDDTPVAYAVQRVSADDELFGQVSCVAKLNSPADALAVYVAARGEDARFDYVLDSHELAEFGPDGASRWLPGARSRIPVVADGSERSVQSLDLDGSAVLAVSPGLIHRVVRRPGSDVLRVIFAPKHVTPTRFAGPNSTWQEMPLGHGVRARL